VQIGAGLSVSEVCIVQCHFKIIDASVKRRSHMWSLASAPVAGKYAPEALVAKQMIGHELTFIVKQLLARGEDALSVRHLKFVLHRD